MSHRLKSIACAACLAAAFQSECATRSEQSVSTIAESASSNRSTIYALRLRPGADLRRELEACTRANQLRAAVIVTAVGSLTTANLRLAEDPNASRFDGPFEIVALVGTLSPDGPHLHIALADKTGRTIGGHLLEGCIIRTTAEIAILEPTGIEFSRKPDPQTGYNELQIRPR